MSSYNELIGRGYEVYVGKIPKGEVDFVAIKNGRKEYYQVAYYLADVSVVEREFGAFSGIPDNFPKYVISMDKFDFPERVIITQKCPRFFDGKPN